MTDNGSQLTLGQMAEIGLSGGPAMLKSENGQLATYVYVDRRALTCPHSWLPCSAR